ncbi:hypothetical protein HMPREF9444_01060 [Succinatimonas hippei YIT 12066]|uniref:Uncharacterized protein n=1 Tax=Succinatimonas hippei (strain DSM 22608 / JCM 16073 / KCTC 15190 / YIT 12066) TaxID=762983 RepID=E8LK23_SUCHY|nr:hypothetical protein HMPREF9444_01060 [Succinatimonas hippei YIT 12066]
MRADESSDKNKAGDFDPFFTAVAIEVFGGKFGKKQFESDYYRDSYKQEVVIKSGIEIQFAENEV